MKAEIGSREWWEKRRRRQRFIDHVLFPIFVVGGSMLVGIVWAFAFATMK